jgi:hypothetical protein
LSLTFLLSFFIHKVHKDTKLDKYIRTDCQFFHPSNDKVDTYFGARNGLYNKKHKPVKKDNKNFNTATHGQEILTTRCNSDNKIINPTELNNINSSRELNTERDKNINKADNLILDENKTDSNAPKPNEDIVLYNNFAKEEGTIQKTTPENNSKEEVKKLNPITLRDYDCLTSKDIPIYDLRPISTVIKDRIYNYHRLLSVINKQSIMDPVIIRSTKLLFHTCSNFAFSALCFTDSYIDKRRASTSMVK